jgi:predicted PurR-regulated permease PerM
MEHRDREQRADPVLLDTLIRAGLILAMVVLCYRIFHPFLTLTVWSVILAVTLYPLHRIVAARLGGRPRTASTVIVLLGIALLVVPTAILMSSLGDSVEKLVENVRAGSIHVPPPPDALARVPLVGAKAHAYWTEAYADPAALVQAMQPKIGDIAKSALGFVASIGGGLLQFLAAFLIAGIVMAFGDAGAKGSHAIFERLAGPSRGAALARLSTSTIRAVAQGVVGVAFIQALLTGLCLLVAGVPWPGALALVVLVLGIAQVPAAIVTLPAIAWIWWRGDHGTGVALFYTALIFVSGMADNVLKPLLLGRGVEAPMPVILLGALGGMASDGIVGMFVGATLFGLGYTIFMEWVAVRREEAHVAVPAATAAVPRALDPEDLRADGAPRP